MTTRGGTVFPFMSIVSENLKPSSLSILSGMIALHSSDVGSQTIMVLLFSYIAGFTVYGISTTASDDSDDEEMI